MSLPTTQTPTDVTLRVDVWSDVVCPWCWIGRRRFEEAVTRWQQDAGPGASIDVTYHSFQLAPDTPVDFAGTSTDFLAAHKGLPLEQVRAMQDQVTQIAASVGLEYHLDRAQHTTTLPAHEVLHLAADRGRQGEVLERLFRAHFTEGRHVGRTGDLVALAAEAGLDADEVRAALADHRYAAAVQDDLALARELGISGVPFTVVDGRYGVSGAQDPAVFIGALQRAAADRAAADVADGDR
ncbi:DsbA family oxidoreductase [Cellulomonas marina]|uniref:Predicted dithiol-disulfide isomerase, DsbA family n=1 Tax=Cellulomonas marina TaxID=988821 RepID=A0A1I0Z7M6_9CELL|nr:DsbA family oxidoreductase [Cellulomonas marina]GIG29056.1 DSBA oxidoreductase [Cellulomonas marina]SFB21521.1 Predicted dithiol-disulfide isomerase, DsbA family [Cellulomonas marina]